MTIAGLTGTTTNGSSIALQSALSGFNKIADWDQTAGTLTLNITQDLQQNLVFNFTVQNGPAAQLKRNVQLKAFAIYTPITVVHSDVLMIQELYFNTKDVAQSSFYPCAKNVFTVTLLTNVPLLATCKSFPSTSYNRYPRITISGLRGTREGLNQGPSSFVSTSPSSSPFHSVNASFTPATGVMVFQPIKDVSASTEHVFSFIIRNQATSQGEQVLSVSADIMSNAAADMVVPSSTSSKPMYIIEPKIIVGTLVQQSSDNPCSVNTISVNIVTNSPIYSFCNPILVLRGLRSQGLLGQPILTDGSRITYNVSSWASARGELNVSFLNAETASSSNLVFTMVNPSLYQTAPGIELFLSYGGTPAWTNDITNNDGRFLGTSAGQSAVLTSADYPLKIRTASIAHKIWQSSPFPCDSNKVGCCWVWLWGGCGSQLLHATTLSKALCLTRAEMVCLDHRSDLKHATALTRPGTLIFCRSL